MWAVHPHDCMPGQGLRLCLCPVPWERSVPQIASLGKDHNSKNIFYWRSWSKVYGEYCPRALSLFPLKETCQVRLGVNIHLSLPWELSAGLLGTPATRWAECFWQCPRPLREDGFLVVALNKTNAGTSWTFKFCFIWHLLLILWLTDFCHELNLYTTQFSKTKKIWVLYLKFKQFLPLSISLTS